MPKEFVRRVGVRLCVWLTFGVLFSLLPVIMAAMVSYTAGESVKLATFVHRGELLLVASAISALSAGDLLTNWRPPYWGRIVLGATVNIAVVVFSTAWYGIIAGYVHSRQMYVHAAVAEGSLRILLAAVTAGLLATALVARMEVGDAD